MAQLRAQAIVFLMNSRTDRIKQRVARNTGVAAGFMTEFGIGFTYSTHAVKLRLPATFRVLFEPI